MTKGVLTVLIVLGVVAALVFTLATSFVSAWNYGNLAEKMLKATLDDNKNIRANYALKVQEAAQIPGMYKDALTEVVTSALSARYGEDGSKAVFQWIKEQNPNVDPAVYIKVQQIVEAGRNEFQAAQTRLIDQRRGYETNLGYFWKGLWLRIAGYPTIDFADYQPVITEETAQAFKTHRDTPIQLK